MLRCEDGESHSYGVTKRVQGKRVSTRGGDDGNVVHKMIQAYKMFQVLDDDDSLKAVLVL